MPTMPNVVGLEFQDAQQMLENAGVISGFLLGFFYTYPVTANWQASAEPPLTVLTQLPLPGATVVVNAPVTLGVSVPPVSVAFP